MGKPWNGDYVVLLRRPDRGPHAQLLPRDRSAQQQAQGLRDGRPSRGARADRLPAGPRRRPPGRLRPGAGEPHRRRAHEALPVAADPDRQDPRVQAAHQARRAPQALPLLGGRLPELAAVFNGPHPETGEDLEVADEVQPEGAPAYDLPPQTAVFAPGPIRRRSPRSPRSCARPPTCPRRPPASWPTTARPRATARPGAGARARRAPADPRELPGRRGRRAPPRHPRRAILAGRGRRGTRHRTGPVALATAAPRLGAGQRPGARGVVVRRRSRAASASCSTRSHHPRAPRRSGSASRRWRRARSSS